MTNDLRFEELEERIAPTVVDAEHPLSFTDSDNDTITVIYDGPDGSSVDVLDTGGNDIEDSDDIGSVTFSGATLDSVVAIACDGAGDNDIVIAGSITAPGDQDVGLIVLGYARGAEPVGDVVLGTGFSINVGGTLGALVINGDIDCDDGGQSITAGGDIGTMFMNNLVLNSTTHAANFAAGGAGGAGNINFIVCEDVYAYTGSVDPVHTHIPAFGSVIMPDDAGAGGSGFITLKLAGSIAPEFPAATCKIIPVVGGGCVLANVLVQSAGTLLTVTTSGTGGDISVVDFDFEAPGVKVSGSPDTDVLMVNAMGSLDYVTNATVGGDIGGVSTSGDLGLVQTAKSGVFGAIYTNGNGGRCVNSLPVMAQTADFGIGSFVDGFLGSIKAGKIEGAYVMAQGIGSISAGPGGIAQTDITSPGGIGAVVSAGSVIHTSLIAYEDLGGGSLTGASIGSFSAPSAIDLVAAALGNITKFTVARQMSACTVSTYIDDGVGGHAGGSIIAFAAGGVRDDCVIESFGTITSVKVGSGGVDQSEIYSYDGIVSIQVTGNIVSSMIQAETSVGVLKIGGDVAKMSAVGVGPVGSLTVGGTLSDSTINTGPAGVVKIGGGIRGSSSMLYVDGSAANIAIAGGIFGDANDKVTVSGDAALVSISGPVYDANLNFASVSTLKVSKSLVNSNISATGSIGSVSVGGAMQGSYVGADVSIGVAGVKGAISFGGIGTNGSIGTVSAAEIFEGAISAGGNIGKILVTAGDIDHNSSIYTGGDLGAMTVKGTVGGYVDVSGNLTGSILTAGTTALQYRDWYLFTDGNGQLTGGALAVGGSVSPGVIIA